MYFYTLPVFFIHYYVFLIRYFLIFNTYCVFSIHFPVFLIHFSVFLIHFYVFLIHISIFLIHYLCISRSHVACDVRAWRKSGPWYPLAKRLLESTYTACSTQLTMGLACTLSLTREYMEHGGRLPANCALTVYYVLRHC